MDWSTALGSALRSWGQAKLGQGTGAQGNAAPGAAARSTFGGSPGSTAGALNSDNRSAYGMYADTQITQGQRPLSYADWLQMRGQGGAPADQGGQSYVGGVQVPPQGADQQQQQ